MTGSRGPPWEAGVLGGENQYINITLPKLGALPPGPPFRWGLCPQAPLLGGAFPPGPPF